MTPTGGSPRAARPPQTTRSPWTVVVGYAVVCASNQMLWLSYAPITTVAAARYGVSDVAIGWLAQIFPLLYVVLALPTGVLLDRWFRPGLLAGALLTAIGALLRLGDSFGWALAGQVLIAVAQPLVLNALTKVVSGYLPVARRPAGIAAGSASVFAGMVLALLLGAVLDSSADLPLLLRLSAAVAVVGVGVLTVALRHPPAYATAVTATGRDRLLQVLGDPSIRRVTLLGLAGFGVFVAMTTWLQALLEPAGVSVSTAGLLLLAMVVAGIAGSAVLPIWVIRSHATQRFLGTAVLAAAAGCLVLAVRPGAGVAAVTLPVIGVALVTALPLLLEIVERRAGHAGATAASLLWMAGNAGGLLVALAVQGLLGHPAAAFALMGAVLLAGFPLARSRRLDPATLPGVDVAG